MAKRFTDTDKWKKPFIRGLPIEYKCFWFYILDDCDHAGIWQVDIEVAELRLGIKLSQQKARGFFSGKVVEFDNESKWFIPDFIFFQYGSLEEKNKMYKPISGILKKYNLMGHLSSINGGKEQVQEEGIVPVKDFGKSENLFPIEYCLVVATNDIRWTKANNTNSVELEIFNSYLERLGMYQMIPIDYKKYFAKLKGRYPDMLKKELSIEDLRKIAKDIDDQNKAA